MSTEQVLVRLLIAGGLGLVGLALYQGWNRFQLRRLSSAPASRLNGLEAFRAGVPGILYFTTPDCQVCLTTQKPALRRLEAELGEGVQIIEVDASQRPELADYWGVLSVPTTFIIDGNGQPQHINHGLTSKDKLKAQLAATRAAGPETVGGTAPAARRVDAGSHHV